MVSIFPSQRDANLGCAFAYECEIDPIPVEWSAHSNERKIALAHRLLKVGRCVEATCGNILIQQLRKTRLVNGRLAGIDLVHLVPVDIDADYFMSLLRQAHTRHQPHVSSSDDRESHHASVASRFSMYQSRDRLKALIERHNRIVTEFGPRLGDDRATSAGVIHQVILVLDFSGAQHGPDTRSSRAISTIFSASPATEISGSSTPML